MTPRISDNPSTRRHKRRRPQTESKSAIDRSQRWNTVPVGPFPVYEVGCWEEPSGLPNALPNRDIPALRTALFQISEGNRFDLPVSYNSCVCRSANVLIPHPCNLSRDTCQYRMKVPPHNEKLRSERFSESPQAAGYNQPVWQISHVLGCWLASWILCEWFHPDASLTL